MNPFFTLRNQSVGTKHVWAGTTRVVSKLMKNPDATSPAPVERIEYFLHSDNLGSTSFVTEADGGIFQHLEYFPFGETWVEEKNNTQNTPYLFTGKQLDQDTELYYYGARYYDPRTSQFISPDPLLNDDPTRATAAEKSLDLYSCARNNPLRMVDPTGKDEQPNDASRTTIATLAASTDPADRQRALDLIVNTYYQRPSTLAGIVYDPNHGGVPETSGGIRSGAQQTITIGPSFFSQDFRARYVQRVLEVGHEL